MSAAFYPQVQKIYVAYYGRPADPAGLQYWAGQLAANGGNLTSIINAFGASAESTALYAGADNSAKVTAIYQQLFNRAPDAAGLAFYTAELTANRMTASSIALNVANGAQGTDATYLNNKVTVATSFTDSLTVDSAAAVAYTGTTATTAARSLITGVTTSAATTNVASTITSIKAGGGAAAGQTFTLTTSADEFSPNASTSAKTTTGDDTFNAGAGRLGSDDSINGGLGNDTLNITLASAAAPIVQGVETINITMRAADTGLDFTDITGATTVNISGTQSGAVRGLSSAQALTLTNGFGNNLDVRLSDETNTADSVTVIGNSASAFTLRMSGQIERLNLQATTNLQLGSSANFTQNQFSGLSDIVVTGPGNVTLNLALGGTAASGATALSAIDASGLLGNLTLNLQVSDTVKVVGGAGNDTIDLGSGLDTLDVIVGGAGTDVVRARVDAGLSTVRPTLTNVETLTIDGFSTAASVDLRGATALQTINFAGTANATVSQASRSIATINLNSAAGAPNFDITYAASNVSDVTVNIGSVGTATGGNTFGDLDLQGNTGNLTLVSQGISANVIDDVSAIEVGALTINATRALGLGDVAADAAGTVTINATSDFSAQSANFLSASTISFAATGTAQINVNAINIGDDLSTLRINTLGDFALSAINLGTASTGMELAVNVTIGSGSTASLGGVVSSGLSALNNISYTLAGSGNVDLSFNSAASSDVFTASIDAVSLGGVLDVSALNATAVAFNISLGAQTANGALLLLGNLADTVIGGAANDTIMGGGGNDQLIGGGGADVYVYAGSAATAVAAFSGQGTNLGMQGIDVISDFSTADTIIIGAAGVYLAGVAGNSGLTALGTLYSAWTSFTTAATAGNASAAPVVAYQRGSDVVISVLLGTGAANIASGDILEIVLQGETLNSAWTASLASTAIGGITLSNLVIS